MRETSFPKPNIIFLRVASFLFEVFFRLYFRLSLQRNRERLAQFARQSRPLIIVFNHTSYLDVPLVGVCIGIPLMRRVTLPGKKELFEDWRTRWIMRLAGVIPLDRDIADTSAVRGLLRALKGGQNILMSPEGTRSSTAEIQPFKTGFLKLAHRAQAMILPVAICGAADALPRGVHWPRPKKLTVIIGEAIDPEQTLPPQPAPHDYDALADAIRAQIAALMAGQPQRARASQ